MPAAILLTSTRMLCSADHEDALQRLEDLAAAQLTGWEQSSNRDDREDATAEG